MEHTSTIPSPVNPADLSNEDLLRAIGENHLHRSQLVNELSRRRGGCYLTVSRQALHEIDLRTNACNELSA